MYDSNSLPTFRLQTQTDLAQAEISTDTPVTIDSPASRVMTDLYKVKAATIRSSISLTEAALSMSSQDIHLLFVVDNMPRLMGLVTTTDLHGVKPMQIVQALNIRYNELTVAHVMTSLDKLEAIAHENIRNATVGDAIATLKHLGRNHLLVVENPGIDAPRRVCGLISRSQIERQLGERIEIAPIASSFAEIERALLHGQET